MIIMLKECDYIVPNPENVSQIFNDYFGSVTESIGEPDSTAGEEPVVTIVSGHREHTSVKAIKERFRSPPQYNSARVEEGDIAKEMKRINPNKSVGHDGIPPKIVKLCADQIAQSFTKIINNCCFPTICEDGRDLSSVQETRQSAKRELSTA